MRLSTRDHGYYVLSVAVNSLIYHYQIRSRVSTLHSISRKKWSYLVEWNFSNCLTSIWEAQVWILSKPYFFLASLLQLLKLQSICKDHFFASFSSVGQMKLISLQVVKNFILHQNHTAVYNFYKWSLCKTPCCNPIWMHFLILLTSYSFDVWQWIKISLVLSLSTNLHLSSTSKWDHTVIISTQYLYVTQLLCWANVQCFLILQPCYLNCLLMWILF